MSTRDLLVTGFTAFDRFDVNPAAVLAQGCGRRHELLEVSYATVDAFLEQIAATPRVARLLMLGVSSYRTCLQIERVARNFTGDAPDVRGEVRGPGPIEPDGPPALDGTLLHEFPAPPQSFSDDAGCYLCNYTFYRALRRLTPLGVRVGFVHVPPVDVMPLEQQRRELARLLQAID